MTSDSQTLSQRIAAGALPIPEALRCAIQLGEAVRHLHDEGRAHGALTPDAVSFTRFGLRLLPPQDGAAEALTPYVAPERLRGQAPDACSDVFAFGAVVYEMLAGRPAFEGDTPEELSEALSSRAPAPLGHPGLDRLVSTCLSKDRAGRWQRMQQVVMELKLLAASERRSEPGVTLRHSEMEAALRAEMEQLESRWTDRFERQQKTLEEATEGLKAVHAQLGDLDARFAEAGERLAGAEKAANGATDEISEIHTVLSGEVRGLYQKVKEQAYSIEAARAGITRTDDLVERVVDALESLQSIVLEQSEERVAVAR